MVRAPAGLQALVRGYQRQMGSPVNARAQGVPSSLPPRPRADDRADCPVAFDRPELLNAALAGAPVLVWAADRDGILLLAEGGGSLLAGISSETAEGRAIGEVFHEIPALPGHFRQALDGEPSAGMAEVGSDLVMDCWTSPLRGPAGEVAAVVGVAVDASARHAAQRQLLAEWRKTEELLQSRDQQRRLIAYEIHDGLIQEAMAAQMRLQALLLSDQVPSGPVRQELEVVLGLVRSTVDEARQFIAGLRPPGLEEHGLVEAVRRLIAGQPPGGPTVELQVSGRLARLEPLLETAIYRIVQEALTNVRRHSRSDRAEVRIARLGDRVEIEVRDWGVGFDPDCVDNERFGLKGIRQRALALRGWAQIEGVPGKGTRVLVNLPLAEASQDTSLSNDRRIE
jgi:PAS domain S-box-containing protein